MAATALQSTVDLLISNRGSVVTEATIIRPADL
jgi:hypothetical protein